MTKEYDPVLVKMVADAMMKTNLEFVKLYGLPGNSVSLGNYAFARAAIDAVKAYEKLESYWGA